MTVTDPTAARVIAAHHAAHGDRPQWLARAPGRVNLIGEHTDYNDGFVLPCAIDRATWVAISPASDGHVDAVALDCGGARDRFDPAGPFHASKDGGWADYVRGMVAAMPPGALPAGGARLTIGGDVPQGAGLSSSAALAVAVGTAIDALRAGAMTPVAIALAAQRAENDFVGCACGNMDQLASACARAGHALRIDCRSLALDPIAIPDDLAILVVHSGIARGLVDSAYNERRAQCEAVARHFGVAALRDLDMAALEAGSNRLDPVALRRARHVVSENARVLAAADALRAGDIAALSAIMAQSHASMRDDFAITVPAIDDLVSLVARAIGADGGARMTGGGFGGCIVVVAREKRINDAMAAVMQGYRTPDGDTPMMIRVRAAAGAHAIKLD